MTPAPRGIGLRLAAYYTYVFAFDCIFGYAIYTGYLALQGLSPAAIGGLLAIWAAEAVVFEVPSGALADRCDRRVLLILAPLIKAGCFVVWALAPAGVVWPYALGFLLWEVGASLQSGTREALFYEHLAAARVTRWYEVLLGREAAWRTAGVVTGCAAGGFIGAVSMPLAFWASLPALVVAAIAAVFLPDIRMCGAQRSAPHLSWAQHIRGAARAFRGGAQLRFLAIYVALGLAVLGSLEEFDQLFYVAVGLPVWVWGLAIGATGLLHMGASLYAHRLRPWRAVLWALPVAAGCALLAAGALAPAPWAVALLIMAYAVVAPAEVLVTARFQRALSGDSRATATSALNVCREGASVVCMIGFGLLADAAGIVSAYQVAGALMLVFAAWVALDARAVESAISCRRRT